MAFTQRNIPTCPHSRVGKEPRNVSVTGRHLGPRKAKYLYDEAWSGFWLMSFITWPSPLSDEKVAAESISRNNRRLKLPVRAADSGEEIWQPGCGLTIAAVILISIDLLYSESPFPSALAKMHPDCVPTPGKDRLTDAVHSGQPSRGKQSQ